MISIEGNDGCLSFRKLMIGSDLIWYDQRLTSSRWYLIEICIVALPGLDVWGRYVTYIWVIFRKHLDNLFGDDRAWRPIAWDGMNFGYVGWLPLWRTKPRGAMNILMRWTMLQFGCRMRGHSYCWSKIVRCYYSFESYYMHIVLLSQKSIWYTDGDSVYSIWIKC